MKVCAMLNHFTPGNLNFAPPQPRISFETKIAQLTQGDDIGSIVLQRSEFCDKIHAKNDQKRKLILLLFY